MYNNDSYFRRNLNCIFYTYNLNWDKLSEMSMNKIKKHVKEYERTVDWRASIIAELLTIRENPADSILNREEVAFMLDALCTA